MQVCTPVLFHGMDITQRETKTREFDVYLTMHRRTCGEENQLDAT
jgi:hypothetical protein